MNDWQSRETLMRQADARYDAQDDARRRKETAMNLNATKLIACAQTVLDDAQKADFASVAGDHEAAREALAFADMHLGFVADEIKALREKLS